MIEELRLRDLGVIADATLPLGAGFTAVTGETGAGKTMVVTALGLLLGQRADSGVVRAGAAQAVVEGVWIVPDAGAAAERARDAGGVLEPVGNDAAELYLGRTLSSEGRSRATVGGRTTPVGVLAELAENLVAVHGQSDQLRLRSAVAQRETLDRFGGERVRAALVAYQAAFERARAVTAELSALTNERDVRAAEADDLRAALAELERVDPQPGEDADLAVRAERLAAVEELRVAAATAHAALSRDDDAGDAYSLVVAARRALERSASTDPLLSGFEAALEDIGYRIADVAGELSGYLADLDELGPQELAAVEERRAQLSALARVHGSLEEALAVRTSGAFRLAELDDDSDRIERLTADAGAADVALVEAAATLTAARSEAAGRLGDAVTAELAHLALPDARLTVAVGDATLTAHGADEVAILLAPHAGADPRPIARGASGGELSRVMLALEVVLAATDPVPTFVFDEVDAGIGGAAAIEVGRRLAMLAETSQVIAVTHLAQVAAFAGNHVSVVKASDGSVTASSIRRLEGAEREAEMARLLSGMPDSDAALEHARELLAVGAAR